MAGVRVHLLGPPRLERTAAQERRPHGRKGWGLLAYLLLHRAPTPRSQLAAILFPGADDPLGALRWHLSDLRRVLGPQAVLQGDPLALRLPPSSWTDADSLAPLPLAAEAPAGELLEGLDFSDCAGFDTWLTVERHRLRHRVETAAYEGGLAALAEGDTAAAVQLAARAVELDALNADFHALLVRALLAAGDRAGARGSAERCARVFADQLGEGMPAEVQQALAAPDTRHTMVPATAVSVRSYLEAAAASLAAGASTAALGQLRVAGSLAERAGRRDLQAEALLALAGALIHGTGGRGAEVSDLLHRTLSLSRDGSPALRSAAYRELGFLAVQRGFPASGLRWLEQSAAAAAGLPDETAKALGVRGMLATDTADYPGARSALQESVRLSAAAGNTRQEAFARAMLGRVHLLTGELAAAAAELDAALTLAGREHWAAFHPLVEAMRSEVYLLTGHVIEASELAEHATALAEAFGDRCFMDAAAHAKAQVLLTGGDTAAAGAWIVRGLGGNPWYRWFRGRNLELACTAALLTDPQRALGYARELSEVSSRYGHNELTVRAYSFLAVLGDRAVSTAIPVFAGRISNPLLEADLVRHSQLQVPRPSARPPPLPHTRMHTADADTGSSGTDPIGTASIGIPGRTRPIPRRKDVTIMNEPSTSTIDADRELKAKHRAMWAQGNYTAVATEIIPSLGPILVRASDITDRDRVLDVAAGTGNAALPAAETGAQVTASDLTPELLESGKRLADARGVSMNWVAADAEALPFGDGAFDAVISCVGIMFAPHHQQAAGEIARVCRRDGRVGLINWTPEGFIGQMFATMKPYAPAPPPGAQPPPLWGQPEHLEAIFASQVGDWQTERRTLHVDRFQAPDDFLTYFKTNYGPTITVYKSLAATPDRAEALDADLRSLAARFGAGSDGGMDWEYLLAVGRRS